MTSTLLARAWGRRPSCPDVLCRLCSLGAVPVVALAPECCLLQLRALLMALRMGVGVLMLDMDTTPVDQALFPATTLPQADLVYVPEPSGSPSAVRRW